MTAMLTNEIYDKGYADGYENGRMSKEPVFFPPCEDCNKKMDEVRKAYDYWKAQKSDTIAKIEKIKKQIKNDIILHEEWFVNIDDLEKCLSRIDAIVDKEISELKGK